MSLSSSIFKRGGQKEAGADAASQVSDAVALEQKAEELRAVWDAPRVGKGLSAAIWRPKLQAAELMLKKGRLLEHMGFMWGGKHYLHAEEAVYLVDRANLLLIVEGAPGGQRLLSLQESYELMMGSGVTMDRFLVYCHLQRAGYLVRRHPSRWSLGHADNPSRVWDRWGSDANDAQPSHTREPPAQQCTLPSDTLASPAIPTAVRSRPVRAVELPELQGGGRAWWPGITAEHRWLGSIAAQAVQDLPRCEVQTKPDVLPPLRPFPGRPSGWDCTVASPLTLAFDVFKPNSKFSRKDPDPPLLHICVCGADPPSLEQVRALEATTSAVPIRFAVVDGGDINYLGMTFTQLSDVWA